ncbi:hypothetical protein [Halobellus sp. GM3]
MSLKRHVPLVVTIDPGALKRARFTMVELVDTTEPVAEWETLCSFRLK